MLMFKVCLLVLSGFLCIVAFVALGQDVPAPQNPSDGGNRAGPISLMSNREFWLSIAIMAFGAFVISVQYILLRNAVESKTEHISTSFLVTIIIIGTLMLISSGFSSEDIAPALGLFGTIAGYLLGRADRHSNDKNDK